MIQQVHNAQCRACCNVEWEESVEGRGHPSPSPAGPGAGFLAPGTQTSTTSVRKRGPDQPGKGRGIESG